MRIVICYDVSDNKLRYRLVKYLERRAVRIQYSVFYGDLRIDQVQKLQQFTEMLFQSYADDSASLLVFPIKDMDWVKRPQLPVDYMCL